MPPGKYGQPGIAIDESCVGSRCGVYCTGRGLRVSQVQDESWQGMPACIQRGSSGPCQV